WLSRETNTRPRRGTGANTAGRVPTTQAYRPARTSSQVRYRSFRSPPRSIPTASPNASRRAAAVAGRGWASGTSSSAPRPRSSAAPTHSRATLTSSSGAGRSTNAPPEPRSASSKDAPFRYWRSQPGGAEGTRRARPVESVGGPGGASRVSEAASAEPGPPTLRKKRPLHRGHARRVRPRDHRGERGHVPLAHPSQELERRPIEEADRRDGAPHREQARRDLLRGAEHPAPHQPAVERHADERPHARLELGGKLVGERTVERQHRPIDADVDGTRERGAGRRRPDGATRTRGGARRRGRSPPRGTPCGRSGRRRPCPRRSAAAG